MSAAQTLATARTLMLRHHGPNCSQRPLWDQLARLLGEAEARATALAKVHGADIVDERVTRPLAIAVAYLDLPVTDHVKEPAHARS